jgi:hypothetical protein
MISPVIGVRAGSPSSANSEPETPSRLKISSASSLGEGSASFVVGIMHLEVEGFVVQELNLAGRSPRGCLSERRAKCSFLLT